MTLKGKEIGERKSERGAPSRIIKDRRPTKGSPTLSTQTAEGDGPPANALAGRVASREQACMSEAGRAI
jgi:hypothetical protein